MTGRPATDRTWPRGRLLTEVIGSGPQTAGAMSYEKAQRAMARVRDTEADPTTLGAFPLAARLQTNTTEELAGFVDELRARLTVCGGDMPRLSAGSLDQLTRRCARGVAAVVSLRDGHLEPLHAVYRRSAIARDLDSVPVTAGTRAFCARLSCTGVTIDHGAGDLAPALQDVDTPEAFDRIAADRPTDLRTGE